MDTALSSYQPLDTPQPSLHCSWRNPHSLLPAKSYFAPSSPLISSKLLFHSFFASLCYEQKLRSLSHRPESEFKSGEVFTIMRRTVWNNRLQCCHYLLVQKKKKRQKTKTHKKPSKHKTKNHSCKKTLEELSSLPCYHTLLVQPEYKNKWGIFTSSKIRVA